MDGGITAGILTKEKSRITYSFPKVRPHTLDTMLTPSRAGLSAWCRFQLSLWAIGGCLRDHDVKYVLKTGLATAVLATPVFIERTRPMFMEYRGEWALISVSVRFCAYILKGLKHLLTLGGYVFYFLFLVLCCDVSHYRRGVLDPVPPPLPVGS
jgi:hypothetical protein